MKILDKYYKVSEVIDDDIEVLSLILKTMKLKSDSKIVNKLENLKLDEYAKEFNILFNEISNKSLKEFAGIIRKCIDDDKPLRKKYTYKRVIQRKKKIDNRQGRLPI